MTCAVMRRHFREKGRDSRASTTRGRAGSLSTVGPTGRHRPGFSLARPTPPLIQSLLYVLSAALAKPRKTKRIRKSPIGDSSNARLVGGGGGIDSLADAHSPLRGSVAARRCLSAAAAASVRTRAASSTHPHPTDMKKAPRGGLFHIWRRGWDSNPRYGRPYT